MKNKLYVLLSLTFLDSCSVGVSELKVDYPDKQNFSVQNSQVNEITKEIDKDISISIKWVGNGYPITTALGITGLKNRYVIPYTRLTSLVNIKINNKSDKNLELNTQNINLVVNETQIKPLDIEYFKTRWPSFSVKTQEMLIDRSVAIGEVIRTIVRDDKITPKSSYQAYIPFLKVPENVKEIKILTEFKIDNEIKNLDFRFIRK